MGCAEFISLHSKLSQESQSRGMAVFLDTSGGRVLVSLIGVYFSCQDANSGIAAQSTTLASFRAHKYRLGKTDGAFKAKPGLMNRNLSQIVRTTN